MKISNVFFSIILATGPGFAQAYGQTAAPSKNGAQQPAAPATDKTRAQRPRTTPVDNGSAPVKPAPATLAVGEADSSPKSVAQPASSPATPSPSSEKPATNPASVASEVLASPSPNINAGNAPDPLVSLRDQIAAAATPQERVSLQLKLVDQLVAAGNRADALAELNRIASTDEFNPQGLYNAGNSFARLGENDGAINAYRKAIDQRKGKYSRALNNLGVVLLRAGRWDEAYAALQSALKLESFRYAEASYNLGRLYAARGENDLAVREWRRVLAIDPQHVAAAQAIARSSSDGRIVVAASDKAQRPPRPQTSEKPVANAAASEKSVNPKSISPGRAPKPLSLDQTSYGFLQRARNASERGNVPDAVDNYRKVIARQGGYFPPANLELSYLLLGLKHYDEAQANLLQVANRDGNRYPVSYFHLARLYELKGDLKQAEEAFSQAFAAYGSENAQFLLDLSRVREKQGEFKRALEAMEQYLAAMRRQGQEPSWSGERVSALRQKANAATPR